MQTYQRIYYEGCNGCPNLIKGTMFGKPYTGCKAEVKNPEFCPRLTAQIYCKNIKEKKMNNTKNYFKMTEKEYFAQQLRKIKEIKGLSNKDIEIFSNYKISDASISAYLNKKWLPRPCTLKILAKTLNVPENYFFAEKTTKQAKTKKVKTQKTKTKKLSFFEKLLNLFKEGKNNGKSNKNRKRNI